MNDKPINTKFEKPSFNGRYCNENCEYISKCHDYCALFDINLTHTQSKIVRCKDCLKNYK